MQAEQPIDFSGFWPFIHLTDQISVPTYFVMISLSFCLGILWVVKRTERFQLSRKLALDLCLLLMLSGLIGSRLFHVVFEHPEYYTAHPLRVLEVWQGGFVFYGGALASFACCSFYLWRMRSNYRPWLDVFSMPAAAGYALGRLACVFTGCCYGAVCHLHDGRAFRYPTQIFAVLWESVLILVLLRLEAKNKFTHSGLLFAYWVLFHAIGRTIMEVFRDDDRGPLILQLSFSTWVSLLIAAFALRFILKIRKSHKDNT